MLKFAAAVALVSMSIGCASYGDHYTVVIDSGYSTEAAATINAALAQWEEATYTSPRPITYNVQYSDSCSPTGKNDLICLHKSSVATVEQHGGNSTSLGVTQWDKFDDASNIFFDIADTDPNFQVTVAHEVGHAMGLKHTGDNTLMCAEVGCVSDTITKTDLEQYLSYRN